MIRTIYISLFLFTGILFSNAASAVCVYPPNNLPLITAVADNCSGLNLNANQNGSITNNGTINGSLAIQNTNANITTISNNISGSIIGSTDAINNAPEQIIGSIINNGLIKGLTDPFGAGNGIDNVSGKITSIHNSLGASIIAETGAAIANTGPITEIINDGLISGTTNRGITNFYGPRSPPWVGNITTITNNTNGTISGQRSAIDNQTLANISTINNSGNISGVNDFGIDNWSTIGVINNNTNGNISGGKNGLNVRLGGSINTLTNNGNIDGQSSDGIFLGNENVFGSSIVNLNNLAAGVITGRVNGISLISGGSISGVLLNAGTIHGDVYGIKNLGNIGSINNSGVISGGTYSIYNLGLISNGIINSGTISSLVNAQGGSASLPLSYSGNLPASYYIYISSKNNYGQITITNPNGVMAFNIAPGSQISRGIYKNIISGINLSNITGNTGVYDGISWKLVNKGGSCKTRFLR